MEEIIIIIRYALTKHVEIKYEPIKLDALF